jgi:hypothetical protein
MGNIYHSEEEMTTKERKQNLKKGSKGDDINQ